MRAQSWHSITRNFLLQIFLASCAHDQRVKFWNVAYLFDEDEGDGDNETGDAEAGQEDEEMRDESGTSDSDTDRECDDGGSRAASRSRMAKGGGPASKAAFYADM